MSNETLASILIAYVTIVGLFIIINIDSTCKRVINEHRKCANLIGEWMDQIEVKIDAIAAQVKAERHGDN